MKKFFEENKKTLLLIASFLLAITVPSFFNTLFSPRPAYAAGTCTCCNAEGDVVEDLPACENYCSGRGGLNSWFKVGEPEVRRDCAPAGGTTTKPAAIELANPISANSVPALIANVIKAVLGIVGALALLMFVYGGFIWLTSGGSPDKIKKGRDVLIWATIGLAVIFASYTLVDAVFKALGAV